ncbi:hypothetical protein HK405_003391 [Cladochytrium tenue]|nr:hypothetical protein HK405_003391 [Cladochytrium tenue]
MAPPSPLPPPPASARSSGVPALLTPGTTTSMPPSLSSASSSLSALSSVSPTPSPSAAATAAATATGPAAGVTASSPDLSSWDPTAPTAASAGVFLKPALAGNLATANVSQAQLGQPPNHRAAVTRARAAQLPARPPDPPPATVHELVHQPGTVWGFVEKLTTAQDRARDPGPIGAESAMSGPQSPAALQWTPRLLVLSDTALYLFSTTHDPYSQPALDALRLGPGSSLRIVADPGAPCAAVILTVSNESREWDLRCTPLPPSVSATTGADDVEAAAAVADPSRAPAPDLETQAWADRLRAAIQLGRSRSKSDVLRRANLEHAIGTAVAAAAAAAASNLQPPANEAAIRSQTQMLLPSEPGQLHEGFSTLALRALAVASAAGAVDTAAAGVVASLAAANVSRHPVCSVVIILHLVAGAFGAVSSFVFTKPRPHADAVAATPPERATVQQRSADAVPGPAFLR